MNVSVEKHKDWVILSLDKNFTVTCLAPVRAELEKIDLLPVPRVGIDLAGVKNIDSSAIGLLVNFNTRFVKKGGAMAAFNIGNETEFIFALLNFEQIAKVYPTRKDFENSIA